MNHCVTLWANEQQPSDLKRPHGLTGDWMSKWKGASGLSLWSATVFIDHLKKESLPTCYPPPLPHPPPTPLTSLLPHFQLAPDGWSNTIRSNYSSPGASSLSLPQTPHRHTLLRQEGKTQLCSAAQLSIHSLVHLSTHSSSHWASFAMSSILRDTAAHCALASSCLPPHPPAHVLLLSTSTVSSPFNRLFPSTHFLHCCHSLRQHNNFFYYISLSFLCPNNAQLLLTPVCRGRFHPSFLPHHQSHTSFRQNFVNEGVSFVLVKVFHSSSDDFHFGKLETLQMLPVNKI